MVNTYSYKAKDGTLITGIPEEIKLDDPRLFEQYKQMKEAGTQSAPFGLGTNQGLTPIIDAAPDPSDPMPYMSASVVREPKPQGTSFSQEVVKGLGQGTAATVRGLATGAANTVGIVVDPITATLNTVLDAIGAPPEMRGQTLGQATKNLLDMIGVQESETKAAKIVEAASTGLGEAVTSVGIGGAIGAGAPLLGRGSVIQEAGKSLATGPLQQALGGVGSGGAAEYARQKGAGPWGQFGAGMAGGVVGSGVENIMSLKPAGVHPMQGVVDASEGLNTKLGTSDVFPPKTFIGKAVQAGGERIPFAGTGPVRAAQQRNRIKDIKNLFAEHGAFETAASASDDVMLDLTNRRDANFARWEDMKDQALKTVGETSPDLKVSMPRTVKKIDEALESLRSLNNAAVKPGIDKLLDAKVSFENQTARNVLKNKQILGDVFKSEELSAVKKIINKELEDTYEAVRLDLTDFVGEAGSPQAKNKWMIANNEETKLFDALDLDILKHTLDTGKTRPEVIKNMLMNKDRSVVEALHKGLTAKGRASAVTAVLQEVAKKTGEDVSPEKFLTEMRRLKTSGDPLGAFMQPDDYKALDGLVRVLKATTRASEAAAHTPTGQQLYLPIGVATGAGVVGNLRDFLGGGGTGTALAAGVGLTGMGLAGAAARIYESAPVRNLLMKLPTVKTGSVEEAALFKRLLEAVQSMQTKP
jgi:hypothetical protein